MNELAKLAKLVRYYILFMTTYAASGHPTSSLSATDLMVGLFFRQLRFGVDKVIFSKGHASPLLYALWAAAGKLTRADLETYRKFGSRLEGHPRPNFEYADVATGSLGQGLSVGVGMALAQRARISNIKYPISNSPRVYVLLGDSEMAEGSCWEAMEVASYYKLSNLVTILDVNRLGQSTQTMLGWDTGKYKVRAEAFGWETHVVDGHNMKQIIGAFKKVASPRGSKPQMIIARTVKGKGVSFLENKEGWHGKVLSQEQFEEAVEKLGKIDVTAKYPISNVKYPISNAKKNLDYKLPTTNYKLNDMVATRKAYGEALAKLGDFDPRVVVLDGETSNSTMSEIFAQKHPKRYFEMFIAEQNMVGVALGMSKIGFIPFASTFAAFLTRAHDQIRMATYSMPNLKIVGSHAGVSIGEDGPSQMGLEDIAMFRAMLGSVVLCPGDAVACEKLVFETAKYDGLVYMRTNRPPTPVIYKNGENFKIGGSKVVRSSRKDKLTIVACGVTLIEAISAADDLAQKGINVRVLDAYSIKPIDEKAIKVAASQTNNIVVCVEDHFAEGGLGDAVFSIFAKDGGVKVYKLAVFKMPMSGKGSELLNYEGISASKITNFIKSLLL